MIVGASGVDIGISRLTDYVYNSIIPYANGL